MAVIISDTGPLLALAGVEQLAILKALFKTVLIPAAVYQECLAKTDHAAALIEQAVEQAWLKIEVVPKPEGFPLCLGAGEQEAMQLAASYEQALLIMDDRLARREAMQRKLDFVGTVRVLWLAQQKEVIVDAAQVIDAMAANGYHISKKLLEDLRLALDNNPFNNSLR